MKTAITPSVMSAKVQQISSGKVPMSIRRRWYVFRREFLPGLAFTCLVVFTLLFWKAYLSPVVQPQNVRVAAKMGNDSIAKEPVGRAAVYGPMGFINE
ncbi:MAG: hypothetical protein M0Q48_03745 [Verrucomicrobia bacterium]|nr:hypothetical protein [Verrucomicrobiota bacterium]